MKTKKKKIAIFASGSGSNAKAIIDYFKDSKDVEVSLILTNKSDAGVIDHAIENNISHLVFNRESLYESNELNLLLQSEGVDLIVLAGFLWLIPKSLIEAFPNKIINIHPSLLPKYGGKGMYGKKVHQAVIEAGEKESGLTIHFVNDQYDDGDIIFQTKVKVESKDTAETLAEKILQQEHKHYKKVIEKLLTSDSETN
ncbi:phosphoribosylglycinamide formyltransferase [Marinigracilibium pacificum]|uniref:Phosphoribosylglycinamide formyltransferase n=1 Tax=Marinigracilibium pacificum TaxID=2729599 RepID=A0A848J5N1_9BACT|nr:phosphoribosylglycinamide formyltransferase [Marinigracilibium pacificum]NMM49774.1 phosphoribosylglycinamide formyltransferase [Marinigracilibium pacificum]